jgi:biopolymer transport protein TolR
VTLSRRRRRQYDLDLVSDINVTSLVDVMMTLLIIFIIVAPMLEQGIDITLPTAEPKRIDMTSVLTISVSENERVYLEGQRVTTDELRERLANVYAAREDVAVLVKADTDLRYGTVVEVLDVVRGIGITRLAMATRPSN